MEPGWSLLLAIAVLMLVALKSVSRLAVHTQQRLANANERDGVIDALVWIHRHTTRTAP
jgi:hypothetical protein